VLFLAKKHVPGGTPIALCQLIPWFENFKVHGLNMGTCGGF
jgi:hypothetical protein